MEALKSLTLTLVVFELGIFGKESAEAIGFNLNIGCIWISIPVVEPAV